MIVENKDEYRFKEPQKDRDDLVHIHFMHRHVPTLISYPILLFLMFAIGLSIFLYANSDSSTKIIIEDSNNKKTELVYGSWPALNNADFFKKTKDDFISQNTSFIEADLSAMILRFYKEGKLTKEVPITTKGRDGSWWETPAGLYKISSKEREHFSSFGQVYMPWSMQFQGNFFIHGPTRYPDGSPTASTYSGGCIRLSLKDAEEIFNLAENGTPVLVFEESFSGDSGAIKYKNKNLLPSNVIYLAADLNNNFVFVENRSQQKHSIASITKLVSALIAVEYINVEREVMISSSMLSSTSIPRLKSGDRISILDLLSHLLLESSNEAALAITTPLGNNQFIKLMNIKSQAIGMTDSKFTDSSGISSANISTAEDLFNLAKYLYHNRSFVLHMSMRNEERTAYGPSPYPHLQNLNLLPGIPSMIGGKTGLSSSSGDSMLAVFEMEIDGQKRPTAIIVLGSDNAKRDIETLLKFINNNFSLEQKSSS